MGFQKSINNFFQAIYKLFVGILAIVAVVLTIAVIVGISFSLTDNLTLIIFLSIAALLVFRYIYINKSKISEANNRNTSGFLFYEIMKLTIGIVGFFFILSKLTGLHTIKPDNFKPDESVILYTDSTDVNFKNYYLSQQSWRDFNREKHSLPFKVNYVDVVRSNKNKHDFKITHRFTWGNFYKVLADYDRPLVEELAQTFSNYQKEKKMNRRDFAELLISAIQDIPYSLILDRDCEDADIKPCYGNIKLGIFTPTEFVSGLKGDCDTRTVLLFTLLSRFNYDIAILNSVDYQHSVLGINIPSTGKFKSYRFKKYYFIETTAKGCPIGYLHKDFSDINKWDFALIHNTKI